MHCYSRQMQQPNMKVWVEVSLLIWFVEVPGSRTNDAKVLHEVLFCKGDGFTRHQCEDAAWNFCWWSNWIKSCTRRNPAINHSWTQIRTESCEGNTGRYYETSLFRHLPIGRLSIWWSVIFCVCNLAKYGSDKPWECLTAACKAFSLVNAKKKGIDGLLIAKLGELERLSWWWGHC